MTWWPPLYPILLSLFSSPASGARVISVLTLAVNAVLAFLLARRWMSLPFALACWLIALFSFPIQYNQDYALSDSLFFTLILAWLLFMQDWQPGMSMIGAAILATLAHLERYIGVVLIPLGVLFILWKGRRNIRQALIAAVEYAAMPALVYLLWAQRNIDIHGFSGPAAKPKYTLPQALAEAAGTVLSWLVPIVIGAVGALAFHLLTTIGVPYVRDRWVRRDLHSGVGISGNTDQRISAE